MSLQNSVVTITGASRGLGREIACRYAKRGAKLVLVARGASELRATARKLDAQTEVMAVVADVAEDAERIAAAALERFGRVDVLINNASTIGSSPMPPLQDLSWEEYLRVLRVNVVAPLHLTQLLLPAMRARRDGVVINVTSDAAVQPYAGWGAYGSSKAALEHMSRILTAELDGSGVSVYIVDPGDMNTKMHEEAEPAVDLSHLPSPSESAPFFEMLLDERPASGRFSAHAALAGR